MRPAREPSVAMKLLRIHLTEGKSFQGKPLHEAILGRCRELGIAGATVFRGVEGYGETAEVHRHRGLHGDLPLVIVIVDEAANLSGLVEELGRMLPSGLLAMSDVRVRRVRKSVHS